WTLRRMRLPDRRMAPSTTASTPNWRPISAALWELPLYRRTVEYDSTFKFFKDVSRVISASVIPSARYSSCTSLVAFRKGRIARELTLTEFVRARKVYNTKPAQTNTATDTATIFQTAVAGPSETSSSITACTSDRSSTTKEAISSAPSRTGATNRYPRLGTVSIYRCPSPSPRTFLNCEML